MFPDNKTTFHQTGGSILGNVLEQLRWHRLEDKNGGSRAAGKKIGNRAGDTFCVGDIMTRTTYRECLRQAHRGAVEDDALGSLKYQPYSPPAWLRTMTNNRYCFDSGGEKLCRNERSLSPVNRTTAAQKVSSSPSPHHSL